MVVDGNPAFRTRLSLSLELPTCDRSGTSSVRRSHPRSTWAPTLTSPDFLSYLLFERPYIERLLELGYEDTVAKWDEVERFLDVAH